MNEEYKLIISLYMNTLPRRSSDYLNCIINQPDDNVHNILVFTKDTLQGKQCLYLTITKTL